MVECQLHMRHCSQHLEFMVEKKPATLSNILVEEINVLANYLKMLNQKNHNHDASPNTGCFTYIKSEASSLPQSLPSPIVYPFPTSLNFISAWAPQAFQFVTLVSNVPGLLVTLASLKTTKRPKDIKDPILGSIWSNLGQLPIALLRSQCLHL